MSSFFACPAGEWNVATAMKMISELKAKVTALTAELAEYKSVHGQLRTAELEKENRELRGTIRRYEVEISRNNLWSYFPMNKEKLPDKNPQSTKQFDI